MKAFCPTHISHRFSHPPSRRGGYGYGRGRRLLQWSHGQGEVVEWILIKGIPIPWGQEWSRVALVCTPVWSCVAATYEWCESPLDGIAGAGHLGACELGAGCRVREAHATAVCRRSLVLSAFCFRLAGFPNGSGRPEQPRYWTGRSRAPDRPRYMVVPPGGVS